MEELDYPNDADGDALRRVATDGSDMSAPMVVDVAVACPDEESARRVADAAAALGYNPDIVFDSEDRAWDCYCSKSMVLTYESIINAQRELDQLAQPFGARSDGWGTFGNADATAN